MREQLLLSLDDLERLVLACADCASEITFGVQRGFLRLSLHRDSRLCLGNAQSVLKHSTHQYERALRRYSEQSNHSTMRIVLTESSFG